MRQSLPRKVIVCKFGTRHIKCGGRTRDRTLDLSRVKGTLSLVSPSARPKNRRRTAAYAAYDFVVSYAIDPKVTPSGTRLGPEWHPLNAPCGAPPRTRWKACTRPPSWPFRFTAKGEDQLLRRDNPLALAVANAILSTVVPWIYPFTLAEMVDRRVWSSHAVL